MPKDRFDFKQFSIQQDRCAMKVGTDGVLLGAWAGDSLSPRRCLDIGTGTGILSLMLAQRFASDQIQIEAVEIDIEAAQQATENIAASPWPEQINVIPLSLSEAEPALSACRYDLIVSNPPFYNATLKPDDQARAVARHKDSLPVHEIAHFAHQHLNPDGRLALIYPSDYDEEVMTAAILEGLSPIRICDVVTRVGKPAKRRMAEFGLNNTATRRETLAIRATDGCYTDAYLALTEAFYLTLPRS